MSKFDSDIVFSIISEYYRYSKRVPMRLVQFNREISLSVWYNHEFSRFSHCLWRKLYCQNPLISEEILNIPTNSLSLLIFLITLCHTRFILPLGISKCNFEPMEAFLNRTNHKICKNMVGEGLLNPIQCIRSSYSGCSRIGSRNNSDLPVVWIQSPSSAPILH